MQRLLERQQHANQNKKSQNRHAQSSLLHTLCIETGGYNLDKVNSALHQIQHSDNSTLGTSSQETHEGFMQLRKEIQEMG